MTDQPPGTEALLSRAAAGDGAAWGSLLTGHKGRLERMVAFRMDPRLRGRVDAADVVQEAFAEASKHRADYFRAPGLPLFLWLRGVVSKKLLETHRHHLGARMRDVKRELSLDAPPKADETLAALCDHLTAGLTRPSVAAARGEVRTRELASVLANDYSVDTSGWPLLSAHAITPDGLTIVGQASHPQFGSNVAYRVILPEPSGAMAAAGLLACLLRRRRARAYDPV